MTSPHQFEARKDVMQKDPFALRANLKIPVGIKAQPPSRAAQHGACGGNGATSWMQEIMGACR